MKNYYNNEEDKKFAGVISSLKSLPHVNTPADFEMNLRRRINNLTYDEKKKENQAFFLFRKTFAPAAALALSVAIVFFFVFDFRSEEDNPFMAAPEVKLEYSSNINTASVKNLLIDPVNITSNDVVLKKQISTPQQPVKNKESEVDENTTTFAGNASDVPNLKRDLLTANRGQNIDRSLRAKPQQGVRDYGSMSESVSFDGFNIINEDNDRTLYQLKARMDSLKKMMRRNR